MSELLIIYSLIHLLFSIFVMCLVSSTNTDTIEEYVSTYSNRVETKRTSTIGFVIIGSFIPIINVIMLISYLINKNK